ncbi:lytic transglycosylase domain-containing protein [Actinokineospora sp. PR83]|uniref:lytic transglycosylase domain-containing protein n=1 Tax=Actinokineospora sp. PR83 TaxID=2884908 RepID=UPI001F23C83F|nr:lytic transglycosylase domain-containing protein [Actinokineospora sp. PR83]MCG8917297.1 lytic transglycosylase domain-containing protein [Actinokineospora sp. PR83]
MSSRGKHRKKRRIPAAAAVVFPVAVVLVVSTGDGVPLPGLAGSGVDAVPPELSVPVSASVSVLAVDGSMPADSDLSPEVLAAVAEALPVPPPAPEAGIDLSQAGIPEVAMRAYARAQQLLAATQPGCKVQWTVLAAIGRIESGHAGSGAVDATGRTLTPILGPVLDGGDTAAVADTDDGRWDGDRTWDRAVGPMQFIPATWAYYGTDGSGDGTADPNNLYDAAVSAARYLCAGGTDMSDPTQRARAIFRYNHSDSYVRSVLAWVGTYADGVTQPPAVVPPPGANPQAPGPGSILAGGGGPIAPLAAAGTTVVPQAGNTPGGTGGVAVPPLTVPGTGAQLPGVQVPVPGLPVPPVTTAPKPPTTTAPKPPVTTAPKPPTTTTPPPVTTTRPPTTTTTRPPATTTTRPPLPGTDWYDWSVWVPWMK